MWCGITRQAQTGLAGLVRPRFSIQCQHKVIWYKVYLRCIGTQHKPHTAVRCNSGARAGWRRQQQRDVCCNRVLLGLRLGLTHSLLSPLYSSICIHLHRAFGHLSDHRLFITCVLWCGCCSVPAGYPTVSPSFLIIIISILQPVNSTQYWPRCLGRTRTRTRHIHTSIIVPSSKNETTGLLISTPETKRQTASKECTLHKIKTI